MHALSELNGVSLDVIGVDWSTGRSPTPTKLRKATTSMTISPSKVPSMTTTTEISASLICVRIQRHKHWRATPRGATIA